MKRIFKAGANSKLDINLLTSDPENVRLHGERNLGAVEASLRRFGQLKPIVCDESGKVLAGNATLRAARDLGWKEIWCHVVDLSEAEARAFAIADNRTAELAEWDLPALLESLGTLEDVPGFDDEEIRNMQAELDKGLETEAPDDVSDVGDDLEIECPRCHFKFNGDGQA